MWEKDRLQLVKKVEAKVVSAGEKDKANMVAAGEKGGQVLENRQTMNDEIEIQ